MPLPFQPGRSPETLCYGTGSGSDRMPAFNQRCVVTLFADLSQLSVASGRYRSRFRNNNRGLTGSAIANCEP